jgi:hypothetical protein
MKYGEAQALIAHLKSLDPRAKATDRMRNKILSMAHEMGWNLTPGPSPQERGGMQKPKIDMAHVNAWCTRHGYLHKPLDDYTHSELPKLVSQFEEVYKSYLKAV